MTTRTDGGERLKRAVHAARELAGIPSDLQLSMKSGVHYDTLMNWYSGRTTPRPAELMKVAEAIDLRLVDLMDVYEGRDPRPPALEEALAELVAELRVVTHEMRLSRVLQEEATAAILRALGATTASAPGRGPAGTHPQSAPGAPSDSGRR